MCWGEGVRGECDVVEGDGAYLERKLYSTTSAAEKEWTS